MADINTLETTEVDVETLMNLVRRRVYALPDARYIMGEIERGRLYADGILRPQPEREGWKGRAKSRFADLVLRAVRLNFRWQEVFNYSIVSVLQLIAEDLHAYERRFMTAGVFGDEGQGSALKFDRAAFEEKFLDRAPFSRRSLSIFRELLTEGDTALELFCGRGELLAAFAAEGIEAVGVDPDERMVSLCLGRGLRARRADIFEYLRSSADASFGGIFAGRVVERLTGEQTLELLELAGRKLRRGGLFVAAANNIDHLPALRNFYMDPSLVRPIPVRLLEFMLSQSGYRIQQFTFYGGGDEQCVAEMLEPTLTREVYPYDHYIVAAVNEGPDAVN